MFRFLASIRYHARHSLHRTAQDRQLARVRAGYL